MIVENLEEHEVEWHKMVDVKNAEFLAEKKPRRATFWPIAGFKVMKKNLNFFFFLSSSGFPLEGTFISASAVCLRGV